MEEKIKKMLLESADVLKKTSEKHSSEISKAADLVIECLRRGNKVLLAGNGGSATQASHIAAEFTGRYKLERKGLPAIALTTDLAAITAISNDYGFDAVFQRKLQALGNKGDVLILLSTSGNSKNILNAEEEAKSIGIKTIALLGKEGGKHKGLSDIEIIVPSMNTPKIQETHLAILHIICELVEEELFKK